MQSIREEENGEDDEKNVRSTGEINSDDLKLPPLTETSAEGKNSIFFVLVEEISSFRKRISIDLSRQNDRSDWKSDSDRVTFLFSWSRRSGNTTFNVKEEDEEKIDI